MEASLFKYTMPTDTISCMESNYNESDVGMVNRGIYRVIYWFKRKWQQIRIFIDNFFINRIEKKFKELAPKAIKALANKPGQTASNVPKCIADGTIVNNFKNIINKLLDIETTKNLVNNVANFYKGVTINLDNTDTTVTKDGLKKILKLDDKSPQVVMEFDVDNKPWDVAKGIMALRPELKKQITNIEKQYVDVTKLGKGNKTEAEYKLVLKRVATIYMKNLRLIFSEILVVVKKLLEMTNAIIKKGSKEEKE